MLQQSCYLIVARNSNVHIAQRGVGVAQSNGGDVDIRCLCQWLMISPGVRNNQEAWLTESCLDLICEGTRGETSSNRSSPSSCSKLQNSTLQNGPQQR